MLLLVIRRSVRNAPLTLAVLVGLLVLVTLLVAAPLYTSALADVGLRATLSDAPLDQRSVRAALPVDRLQQSEHTRLSQSIRQEAQEAAWLNPTVLAAIRTKRLILPGGDASRRVALVEADTALDNLRTVEGRLPTPTGADTPVEIVVGTAAADELGLSVGDTLALLERADGEPLVPIRVVGLVEPANSSGTFWQSGVLDLEPVVSATRREASLVVASGMLWTRVVPLLPPERSSGEYRWRIVFDTSVVDGSNALEAEVAVGQVLRRVQRALSGADVATGFGGIVDGYRQRLSIARAPILLLLVEIAGLALIYVAWTAAFQSEATASEQAVMGARGAAVGQIVGISSGQAALLAGGAALLGIPLALLLLRVTANLGPVAGLARSQGLRLVTTPDAGNYALAASAVGLLALAVPAVPAARRSIVALRQGGARPASLPLWQRTYLDLVVVVVAVAAFVQLQRQGTVLQRLRGRFEIDPFLVVAPFLVLVAGALLFLRVYPWLLNLGHGLSERRRGLPVALALVQLTRNRAASTRLVLLLSLAVALGLFAQTFGATLALNQQQRAGYTVGADGRATLTSSEPLLPGALPPGVQGAWALRDTVKAAGGRGVAGTLLAIDPARFGSVAYNPRDRPVAPLDEALSALGPAPEPEGLALPGRPRQLSLTLQLNGAPFSPAAVLSDAAGRFHRLRLAPVSPAGPRQTFAVTLDLPEAAFPLRLVTLALLPTNTVRWEMRELSKPPATVVLESLAADGTVLEQWDGQNTWEAETDSNLNPDQAAAGRAELEASDAGQQPVTIILGRATRAVLLRSNPQELEPVPVGVNEPFLQANNLAVGDTALFLFRNRLVMVRVAAVLSRFPSVGIDAEPFVVAHGPRLLRLLNSSYARPVAPNEVWLDLPGDATTVEQLGQTPGIGALLLQTAVLRSFSRDPLAVGIAGVFFLGFVTSVGLTALGFAIATYLAGRRRTVEFAVLQAIGLDRRAVLGTLALEQAVLVVLALLAGTGLGAALGHLILPLMAVSDRGRAVVPPYVVIVPWRTLVVTYAALIGLFAGVTLVVLRLLLRRGIGSALRIGEE